MPAIKTAIYSAVFPDELARPFAYLFADATEDRHRSAGVSRVRCGRVLEAMVDALAASGKDWACLAGVVADHDDVVEILPDELISGFRVV